MTESASSARAAPIRYGMVGGGEGAFIGAVHRHAARLDGEYVLVAGALSSNPERARRSGEQLGLSAERIYDDYRAMAQAEARRADGIEVVVIVTPNHVHAPAARAFLEAGIHVICDKPVTTQVEDAVLLRDLARERGLIFAVTHNYSGNAMVRHARELAASGALGELRFAQAEYLQGWLAEPIEQSGQKQASWRTDPSQSGGGAIGDIGSHAWQLIEFVTGRQVQQLSADLVSFVPGRQVDDHVQITLRCEGGLRASLTASQVAVGHANDLRLRVYGSQGGLEWRQEDPDRLYVSKLGEPTQIVMRGGPGAGPAAARLTRVPGGHPEGYLEAFANLYAEVARALRAHRAGAAVDVQVSFPTIDDGLRGVRFIEAVQASSRADGAWTPVVS